jgi:GWxTD domain-containing protein
MLKAKLHINYIIMAVMLTVIVTKAQNSKPDDIPAVSRGDIQFYTDYAVFKGAEGNQHTEFYLMVFADQLTEVYNKVRFVIETKIEDAAKNEISSREWTTEADITRDSFSVAKVIYDQWNQVLPAGNYRLNVKIKDKESGKTGSIQYLFNISGQDNDEPGLSNIEFVSRVDEANPGSPFKKGNKTVIPNPSRRYGVLNPVLYTYYELYTPEEMAGKKISINYSLTDVSANVVKEFPVMEAEIIGTSAGFNHGLNVSRVPSGIYELNIKISIPGEDKILTAARRLEVIQKDYTELQPVLSVNDAETFGKLLKLIGDKNQLKIYRQLQLSAKANFIVQYWKSVDPTPGTPENEYLEKIQQRFVYANKNFSWGEIPGWETERGRVMIQYGMPDEIEKYNSEADRVPYEIWQYMQEKNFYFVFGDLNSNGRYILLHSNKDGEVSNENWQSEIKKM